MAHFNEKKSQGSLVTLLFLDILLLRQCFLQLLRGDQFLIDENLTEDLALMEIIEYLVDFPLRGTYPDQDLTKVLIWLYILDLQGQIKLLLTDDPLCDENLSQFSC
jgi:hypothetical protein